VSESRAAKPTVSAERSLSLFFLTQFMSGGAATAFAGIWFTSKGLSAEQVGLLNSVPIFILLALNLIVGRLADRAGDWRQIIVLGSIASAIVPFGLFFVQDFWGILLFWSLTTITAATITPVADAAAMRVTRRNGTDFGAIRAWGTIGYLSVIFITGYLVQWLGGGAFLPWFVGLALLRGLASLTLPKLRAPEGQAITKGAAKLLHVMKPWFLLPLFGWSMVFATHLILNGFQSLLWSKQGISTSMIGILIALGALSEAAMFFAFKRFSGRYTARKLILLSSVVTVARWIAMAYSPSVPVLFALQFLHSITFALGFLGCMNFIANWTSEDIAAEAQGFFTMLQQGTAVVAITGFGWLAGEYGAKAYLASAAFAAVGAVLVYLSIRLQPPKEQGA
jgi:PPP family 3-phenylpropionic acid transporter